MCNRSRFESRATAIVAQTRRYRHLILQQLENHTKKGRIIISNSETIDRIGRQNSLSSLWWAAGGDFPALKAWRSDYVSFVTIVIWWFCAQTAGKNFSSVCAAFAFFIFELSSFGSKKLIEISASLLGFGMKKQKSSRKSVRCKFHGGFSPSALRAFCLVNIWSFLMLHYFSLIQLFLFPFQVSFSCRLKHCESLFSPWWLLDSVEASRKPFDYSSGCFNY